MSEKQPGEKEGPAATVQPPAEAPAAKMPPLELRRGARLQLGYRLGRVETVRGGGAKPYDVRVRWEGEKYPVWLIHATLERDHARGFLKVL